MADVRANAAYVPPLGGAGKAIFWTPIQNKGDKGETVTYADPASNKEVEKKAESNCAKEEYTNGTIAFPPSTVFESWSAVTTKTVEPKYSICGLTFDLAMVPYGAYPGTSLGEATTLNNYLQYVLDTVKETLEKPKNNGGQALIKNHDFEPLVPPVLDESQDGAELIKF
jgi:hypothetical protein